MVIPKAQPPFARSISNRSVRPDGNVVGQAADDEPEDAVAVPLDGLLVALPATGAARRRVAHQLAHAVVLVPARDEVGVVGLQGPQVDELAAQAADGSAVGLGRDSDMDEA